MSYSNSYDRRYSNQGYSLLDKNQLLEMYNPEVFTVSPRPGGYINFLVPTRSLDRITIGESTNKEDRTDAGSMTSLSRRMKPSRTRINRKNTPTVNTSREYRVSRAFDKMNNENVGCESTECDDEFMGDFMGNTSAKTLEHEFNMAAVKTLQTVLCLGEGDIRIKDDFAITAFLFLQNIRDEDGNIPPNCRKVLNHLRYLNVEKVLDDYNLDRDGKPLPPEKRKRRDPELNRDFNKKVSSASREEHRIEREERVVSSIDMQESVEKPKKNKRISCLYSDSSASKNDSISPRIDRHEQQEPQKTPEVPSHEKTARNELKRESCPYSDSSASKNDSISSRIDRHKQQEPQKIPEAPSHEKTARNKLKRESCPKSDSIVSKNDSISSRIVRRHEQQEPQGTPEIASHEKTVRKEKKRESCPKSDSNSSKYESISPRINRRREQERSKTPEIPSHEKTVKKEMSPNNSDTKQPRVNERKPSIPKRVTISNDNFVTGIPVKNSSPKTSEMKRPKPAISVKYSMIDTPSTEMSAKVTKHKK